MTRTAEIHDHGRHGATVMDGRRLIAAARPLATGGYRVKIYGAAFYPRPPVSAVTGTHFDNLLVLPSKRAAFLVLNELAGAVQP